MQSFEYFNGYRDYFWALEEKGEVIVIRDGSTIAYSQLMIQLLEDLSDQGLPPFGALLLAVLATNYPNEDNIGQVGHIIDRLRRILHPDSVAHSEGVVDDAIRFLRLLNSLSPQYTTGNKRIQLFQLLFADCHGGLSIKLSKQIIAGIRELHATGISSPLLVLSSIQPFKFDVFYNDFRCIALLLRKFPDAHTLIDKLAGIPELEEPILPDEADPAVPGDFVQTLIDHPTSFPVGALIKSLWSGMSIPIHHTMPSAQPLGGFSDLSNKGDLDKLLVSEFAGDDWVFLSRLANNEALYLHRETPPGADPLERIILIDVSLKSWGSPKILAYAILLAIAKHPKTDIPCTAYAVGSNFYPVAVDSVDAVIQSIQLVDGALHPAEGLIKFFESSPARKKTEIFFIASSDTMRHPAIQKVISDYYHHFKYWVTAGAEGELLFYRNQHKGKKLIQRLFLPLERLWQERAGRKRADPPGIEGGKEGLRVPILFPPPTSAKKVFVSFDLDLYAITKERHLLRHSKGEDKLSSRGWQLVLEEVLPSASHFAMGPDNGQQMFLCFKVHNRELTIYRLDTGESNSVLFNDWKPSPFPDFFFDGAAFYYMNYECIWRFNYLQEIEIEKTATGPDQAIAYRYDQMQQQAENQKAGTSFGWSVLKNINTVFINRENNLVFNKHELVLSRTGHIQLLSADRESRAVAVPSEWNSGSNEFAFPGGSKIKVHRSGMLILQRLADNVLQQVYIPAALDASLAAATDSHFAGNMYYYPSKEEGALIKMDTAVFYEENIRSFIQHILHAVNR